MSELDAFSDTEWLDISSGRDSDDHDSLSDQDSDRDEISSASRSRRSSFSTESSVGGDVEAWEGFVSDSGDEAVDTLTGMYPVPLPSALGAEPIAVGFIPNSTEAIDPAQAEEDQRVKEALDQSFVGTLSGSRSSAIGGHQTTSSGHTSIRDLRLSFPDPLTSSRDELSRSYETVSSPTESTASSSTDNNVSDTDSAAPITSSPPLAYPGLSFTTPEVQRYEDVESHPESEDKTELDIVLYGSSSEVKWTFVQELIEKAVFASGHTCTDSLQEGEEVQTLRLIKQSPDFAPFFNTINVYDHTNDRLVQTELDASGRPSLAIVYLPTTRLPVLAWHTAFFPVLVPPADGGDTVMRQVAEDDWDLLAVPPQRTLKIGTNKSYAFDSKQLADMKPLDIYTVLSELGQDSKRKDVISKPLTEQIKSVNAVTIFALMSIVMGFAFNTAFKPSTPAPTPTINTPSSSNGQLWGGIFAPQPNRSSTAHVNVKSGVSGQGVNSNPFSSVALSVYDGRTTSVSVTSSSSMSLVVASSSKAVVEVTTKSSTPKCNQCGKSAGSDKSRASTDVVVRSAAATSLSEIPQVKSSLSVVASRANVGTSIFVPATVPRSTIAAAASAAASVNLNKVFDATTKAFTEAVSNDLAELAEVADELMTSIREQTDNIVRQSKGKARAIGEQLQNLNEEVVARNERAKKRAREIKQYGEELFLEAAEGLKLGLKERTGRARRRAKELKQTVVDGGNEAWKSYEKAQEEWEGVLLGKAARKKQRREERRQERQERKQGRKQERQEKKQERTERKQDKRESRNAARAEKENTPRHGEERQGWKGFGSRRRMA